jgi:hypothetical protein
VIYYDSFNDYTSDFNAILLILSHTFDSIPSALVFYLRDFVTLVTFVSIAIFFKTSLAVFLIFLKLTPCQNSDLTNKVDR